MNHSVVVRECHFVTTAWAHMHMVAPAVLPVLQEAPPKLWESIEFAERIILGALRGDDGHKGNCTQRATKKHS